MTRDRHVRPARTRTVRKDSGHQRPSRPPHQTRRPMFEALEDRVVLANDLFIVPGAAGETYRLAFDWVSREAAFNNEIGIYQVDDSNGTVDGLAPSAAGYSAAAAKRALPIFQSGLTTGAKAEITVNAGQRLGLYLVQNGRTGDWQQNNPNNVKDQGKMVFFSFDQANPDKFDHVQSTVFANNTQTFSFEDLYNGGDKDFNDAVIRLNLSKKDPFRVPGTTSQTVPTTFQLESRTQSSPTEVGVIVVDDASGKIGSTLPSDAGYAAAALGKRQTLFRADQQAPASTTVNLPGAAHLLYYIIDRGTAADVLSQNPTNDAKRGPHVLFSSFAASPDGIDHVRFLGDTRIGFEDTLGGGDRDFNDAIISFSFGTPTSTNTPPTVTAQLINDTAGAQGTNSDSISSDPSVRLRVTDNGTVSSVRVGLDDLPQASYLDVTSRRQPDGTINLDRAFLDSIGGSGLLNSLTQGAHTLRVIATDNENQTTTFNFAFTFDSQTPTPTVVLDSASDTGATGDNITNLAQVTLRGTGAEANARLTIVGTNLQADADAAGVFTLTNVPLQAGANALVVRATDRAGNTADTPINLTRDSELPTASASLVNDTAGPTGTTNDAITSDPRFTVQAADNRGVTSLRIGLDNQSENQFVEQVSQLNNGSLSISQALLNQLAGGTLGQGAHTLRVRVLDAAGNLRSIDFPFTFDSSTTTPTAALATASDTGTVGDGITSVTPVTIAGTAEPNARVQIDGTNLFATASTNGSYQITGVVLSAGLNNFVITSTDPAGNTSQTNLSITLDSELPAVSAQLVSDTFGADGTNTDGISSNPAITATVTDNRAVTTLRAAIDPGTNATLTDVFAQLQQNGTIAFSQTVLNQLAGGTLSQGPHTLRIVAGDAAGNERTVNFNFTFDSTIATPTLGLASDSDTGTKGDLQTAVTPVTLTGTTDPFAQVVLVAPNRTTTADATGAFQFTGIDLVIGNNSFTVQATDRAGNTSQRTITVVGLPALGDVTLPAVSAQLVNDTAGSTGTSTDRITSDPAITVNATDNTGVVSLRVGLDNTPANQFTEFVGSLNNGVLSLPKTILDQLAGGTLSQGPHTLHIRAFDGADNSREVSFTFTFDTSTVMPTVGLATSSNTGSTQDLITSLALVTLTGTAEPGATVRVGGTNLTGIADSNGVYSIANVPLVEGLNQFLILSTDLAGNGNQNTIAITRDSQTAAPTALLADASDTGTKGDLITSAGTVTLTGSAEIGARVEIVGTNLFTTADAQGNYTLTGVSLAPGSNSLTIRSTDIAGNTQDTALTITRDIQNPAVNVALQNDTAGPTGSTVDGLTNDPTMAGTATDNTSLASLRVGLDAQAVDQYLEVLNQVGTGGAFVLSSSLLNQLAGGTLSQGSHTVRLIARDVAGNVTNVDRSFILDSVLANPTLSLDRASDSGTIGDNITNAELVTINGTTEPNTEVKLLGADRTVISSSTGAFTFANVPLALNPSENGKNVFVAEVRDAAGNLSSRGIEIIRRNQTPTLVAPIADITRSAATGTTPTRIAIELADNFADADTNNSLVRFDTNYGVFDIETLDATQARTVANFLNYVERGAYNNTFFHRRPTPLFVLQGGSFGLAGTAPNASLSNVPTDPSVPNQFGPSNLNGTVAFARVGGQANSATSSFFVNLVNNTGLDSVDGGFSVFGNVTPATRPVIDAMAALPVQGELPLVNFPPPPTGTINNLTPANLAWINSATVVRRVEDLNYTVTVTNATNANLFTVETNNRLFLSFNPNQTGSATVTVRATDRAGAFVEDTFNVTVT